MNIYAKTQYSHEQSNFYTVPSLSGTRDCSFCSSRRLVGFVRSSTEERPPTCRPQRHLPDRAGPSVSSAALLSGGLGSGPIGPHLQDSVVGPRTLLIAESPSYTTCAPQMCVRMRKADRETPSELVSYKNNIGSLVIIYG